MTFKRQRKKDQGKEGGVSSSSSFLLFLPLFLLDLCVNNWLRRRGEGRGNALGKKEANYRMSPKMTTTNHASRMKNLLLLLLLCSGGGLEVRKEREGGSAGSERHSLPTVPAGYGLGRGWHGWVEEVLTAWHG